MEERIERFRRQVEAHFGGRPGPGARYPLKLRFEAATLTRTALSGGARLRAISRRLGVGAGTLKCWLDSPQPGTEELRPVEIVELDEPVEVPRPGAGHLVLVTASGHRVEGLALEEVVLLCTAGQIGNTLDRVHG